VIPVVTLFVKGEEAVGLAVAQAHEALTGGISWLHSLQLRHTSIFQFYLRAFLSCRWSLSCLALTGWGGGVCLHAHDAKNLRYVLH